jgi:hypothetical protein
MTADFLDRKRDEIAARVNELKPLVGEYERLQAAVAALDGITAPAARVSSGPRASARANPSRPRNGTTRGQRGRPKGSGKRGEQALAVITAHPGITIPELAAAMGITQNYLYRVLPGLAENRRVRKEGRGWYAVPEPSS